MLRLTSLRILAASLLVVPAVTLGACGSSGGAGPTEISADVPRDDAPDVSDADYATLIAGDTTFALDLYQQLATTPGNLFFSPHSISQALAMTYAGAAGDTATQMATALDFTLPPMTLHAAMDRLDLELASRGQTSTSTTEPFQLHVANSIWGQQGVPFQAPFLDTLAIDYGSGLHVEDFQADAEDARTAINDWVADQTNDKIENLLPAGSVDSTTRLVLTNAIYFTAAWANPFKTSDTTTDAFTTAAGTSENVPTMHETAEMGFGSGSGYQAAELPYDGDQLSMVVVVPDSLADFESSLTIDSLAAIVQSLQTASVTLSLPKIQYTTPISLSAALTALGMTDAFTPDADFSGIDGARDLQIAGVLHKGYIGVDEAGTEAAAATAVVIGTNAAPEAKTLVVNKPYVFFIRDNATGAILFVGRVEDPSATD